MGPRQFPHSSITPGQILIIPISSRLFSNSLPSFQSPPTPPVNHSQISTAGSPPVHSSPARSGPAVAHEVPSPVGNAGGGMPYPPTENDNTYGMHARCSVRCEHRASDQIRGSSPSLPEVGAMMRSTSGMRNDTLRRVHSRPREEQQASG